MKLLGLLCALATAVAVAAHAEDNWGDLAVVSGTMGTNAGRLCMGEGSRVGDIGCPTYAPETVEAQTMLLQLYSELNRQLAQYLQQPPAQ
jgi:hypothetical protein